MLPTMFGCAQQGAVTPLSVSLSNPDPLTIVVPPGSSGATSNPDEVVVTATASGGDGTYSYAWSIKEDHDPDSSFAVDDLGTTDQERYNDAIFSTSFSVPLPPAPPPEPPETAEFSITCTVTDGTGATASASAVLLVDASGA